MDVEIKAPLKRLGQFAFVWLLLPNLPFIALSLSYCPSRAMMILTYGLLGLNRRVLGAAAILPMFIFFYLLDLTSTVAKMFGMTIREMVAAIDDAADIHLLAEPRYIILALLAAAAFGLTVMFALRTGRAMRQVPAAAALLLSLGAAAADAAVNADFTYGLKPAGVWTDYWTAAAQKIGGTEDETAVSALSQSGVAAAHMAGSRRNLLVVMVESLGKFTDDEANRRLYAAFDDPAIGERYSLSSGTVPFFGSTTAGEMRELCGRRDSYLLYLDSPPDGISCLPALLRDQGYRTVAIHGFTKDFFDRERWYPALGFDKMYFHEEHGESLGLCGRVFAGACDRMMGGAIARLMADEPQQPKLVYWLTLNSHFPVSSADLPADTCTGPGDPMICRMATLWREVFAVIAGLAKDDGLPPMDILIVGDHAPPLFSRSGRAAFSNDSVPWLALTRR